MGGCCSVVGLGIEIVKIFRHQTVYYNYYVLSYYPACPDPEVVSCNRGRRIPSVYQACHDRRVRSRISVSHGHGIHSVPVTGCDQILEDSANSRPQDCLDVYWITMLCSAELPGIPYLGVFFTCCHHHKCNVLSLSATTTHQPHAHTPVCVSAHVRTR